LLQYLGKNSLAAAFSAEQMQVFLRAVMQSQPGKLPGQISGVKYEDQIALLAKKNGRILGVPF
jgi:hypothetical protein